MSSVTPLVHTAPMAKFGKKPIDAEIRFWAKVDAEGDCWQWTASIADTGYGVFYQSADSTPRMIGAHRFAWQLLVGPIPPGLTLDHLCRNRGCVNPDHLEPVTLGVNVLRGANPKARAYREGTCTKGHLIVGDNVYEWGGYRRCRNCMLKVSREAKRRRVSGREV